jgi:hypothetical protein
VEQFEKRPVLFSSCRLDPGNYIISLYNLILFVFRYIVLVMTTMTASESCYRNIYNDERHAEMMNGPLGRDYEREDTKE